MLLKKQEVGFDWYGTYNGKESNVKNHIDMLIFYMAICAESVTNCPNSKGKKHSRNGGKCMRTRNVNAQ